MKTFFHSSIVIAFMLALGYGIYRGTDHLMFGPRFAPNSIVCDGNGRYQVTSALGRIYGFTVYNTREEAEVDRASRLAQIAEKAANKADSDYSKWKPCP